VTNQYSISSDLRQLELRLSPMIHLLDDTDVTVINEVQSAIVSLGNTTIPILKKSLLTVSDTTHRQGIVDTIRKFQLHHLRNIENYLYQSSFNNSYAELEQCLIELSSFGYPETIGKNISHFLDEAALEVHQRYVKNATTNYVTLYMALNDIFFHHLDFRGDDREFFHPDSSYLYSMLDQKRGIPITLCALYMLIAERCGIEMYGVGLPLHFLTYNCDAQMYIDVFNYGIMLTESDCKAFVRNAGLVYNDNMLQRSSNKSIIERMIRNLIMAHDKYGDLWEAEQLRRVLNKKK